MISYIIMTIIGSSSFCSEKSPDYEQKICIVMWLLAIISSLIEFFDFIMAHDQILLHMHAYGEKMGVPITQESISNSRI